MRVLNIIESGYRATIEGQGDSVIWIMHAIASAGARISLLFRANAVNYLVKMQHVSPVSIGARQQKQGPDMVSAIYRLINQGVAIYVDGVELRERGIHAEELIHGAKIVSGPEITRLFDGHDRIWYW